MVREQFCPVMDNNWFDYYVKEIWKKCIDYQSITVNDNSWAERKNQNVEDILILIKKYAALQREVFE